MCWVMPPASPATTLAERMRSSSSVLPWSTWPMTVMTGGRGALRVGIVVVVVVEQRLQLDLLLLAGIDEQEVGADLEREQLHLLVGERHGRGDHLALLQQEAHDVGGGAVQLGRELLRRRAPLDDDRALGHRRVGRRVRRRSTAAAAPPCCDDDDRSADAADGAGRWAAGPDRDHRDRHRDRRVRRDRHRGRRRSRRDAPPAPPGPPPGPPGAGAAAGHRDAGRATGPPTAGPPPPGPPRPCRGGAGAAAAHAGRRRDRLAGRRQRARPGRRAGSACRSATPGGARVQPRRPEPRRSAAAGAPRRVRPGAGARRAAAAAGAGAWTGARCRRRGLHDRRRRGRLGGAVRDGGWRRRRRRLGRGTRSRALGRRVDGVCRAGGAERLVPVSGVERPAAAPTRCSGVRRPRPGRRRRGRRRPRARSATGADGGSGRSGAAAAGADRCGAGSTAAGQRRLVGLGARRPAAGSVGRWPPAFFVRLRPRPSWPASPASALRAARRRISPSRSARRRTRSACASSMLDEWLFTPMPSATARSSVSLLVMPSSLASSWTRIFAARCGQPFVGDVNRFSCAQPMRLSSAAGHSRMFGRISAHRSTNVRSRA